MPEKYHVIGLMSGTSLDGLDIAFVEFILENGRWQYEILATDSVAYDSARKNELGRSIHLSELELAKLDTEYGQWLGKEVRKFIDANELRVDLIASHGHTVFHQPDRSITRQIGDGQSIADISGITTICDFRTLDVELGGQGAPLVPIGDKLLFSDYQACLNLGGIANISFDKNGERLAFDIGMANMPLNHFSRQLGFDFDKDGAIASGGQVNRDLLSALDNLNFYAQSPPKSLGVEWFIKEMLPLVNSYSIPTEDKLSTLVQHEAYQIARVISSIGGPGNILVTGGGANNRYFMQSIEQLLESGHNLVLPSEQLIDFKEALIFALMGVLRTRNEINCLKSVTGAKEDSSSGRIFYPKV